MGYVLAGLLVVLIVGMAVALTAWRARQQGRRRGGRAASDASYGGGSPGSESGILALDQSSPLGDTSEHSGERSGGETVADPETRHGGGRPR